MSLCDLPTIKAFDQLAQMPTEQWHGDIEGYDETIIASDNGDIDIYGVIGRYPNSEMRVSEALREIGPKDVTVNINSPGGSYYTGLVIYNQLRQHKAKVTINVLGVAASAASIIAMSGDEIMLGDGANIMVHCASVLAFGNKFALPDITEVLAEVDAEMAKIYAARAGVEYSIATEWMDRKSGDGKRFYADEAIKLGLADGKLAKSAVRAEEGKTVPVERRAERALMRGEKLSAAEAKAMIGALKFGERDAAHEAERDAGPTADSLSQLIKTMTK